MDLSAHSSTSGIGHRGNVRPNDNVKENRDVNMRGKTPANPGKRRLRFLTIQEKLEAIDRVHEGKSKASVARDICVPESTLRGWCKAEYKLRGNAQNRCSTSTSALTTYRGSENGHSKATTTNRYNPYYPSQVQINCLQPPIAKINKRGQSPNRSSSILGSSTQVPSTLTGLDSALDSSRMMENPSLMYLFQQQLLNGNMLYQMQRQQMTQETQQSPQQQHHQPCITTFLKQESSIGPTDNRQNVKNIQKSDALRCGNIFLHWLKNCSDPNVSATNVIAIKTLIEKLQNGPSNSSHSSPYSSARSSYSTSVSTTVIDPANNEIQGEVQLHALDLSIKSDNIAVDDAERNM